MAARLYLVGSNHVRLDVRVCPPLGCHIAILGGALTADGGPDKLDTVRDPGCEDVLPPDSSLQAHFDYHDQTGMISHW